MSRSTFEISEHPIDAARLAAELREDSAGAYSGFEGWVRNENEGREVTSLEYEAHAPVAVKEGQKILAEALETFGLVSAAGCHRVGHLRIGECAVWVGVSAAHRDAAFQACRYIIDELKRRLPIWKKEHYRDGRSSWINCVTGQSGERDHG